MWAQVATSIIAGAAAVLAAWVGVNVRHVAPKLDEIHVLVNNRLDSALKEIAALRERIPPDDQPSQHFEPANLEPPPSSSSSARAPSS